jgi:hypothetical protein
MLATVKLNEPSSEPLWFAVAAGSESAFVAAPVEGFAVTNSL